MDKQGTDKEHDVKRRLSLAIDPGEINQLVFSPEELLLEEKAINPTISTMPDIKSQIIAEVLDEDKISGFGDYGDSSDDDSYGQEDTQEVQNISPQNDIDSKV